MWTDVCEAKQSPLWKHSIVGTRKQPPVLAEKNTGTAHRAPTREAGSRCRSPGPSIPSGPQRCSSPNATRSGGASAVSVPKRAISAERKRSSSPRLLSCTPSTPPRLSLSTPVKETSAETVLASRKIIGNQLPEGLWPSTMRRLSVAFQSDSFSLPISKREKPAIQAVSGRTSRSSSNVERKQCETPPGSRKPTPERKRSPLKGKNSVDQSENSRPVDGPNARLVDQHRWPRRAGGKLSSAPAKYTDHTDKTSKTSLSRTNSVTRMPSIKKLSSDGVRKSLENSANDLLMLISSGASVSLAPEARFLDDSTVEKASPGSHSSLSSGSYLPSPSKASVLTSSVSRGVSPSRTRTTSTASSRGPSPSRARTSSPSRQCNSTNSVLSFIVDIKKGKKAANHIEDAHLLRLLYNRHLQWLYANAQLNALLHSQKVKAEKALYNVWRTSSDMLDSVIAKRIELQQLRLKLKLHSVLDQQLAYLDQWALIERDHTNSLSLAAKDLQACTLRLPITGRARADIGSLESVFRSAGIVMQAIASSLHSIVPNAEVMNCLISELADVGAQQRAGLRECEALLASTEVIQVKEFTLRTHLIQLKQSLDKW